MARYSLGEILLKEGLISQIELDDALQQQREYSETRGWHLLGEILVKSERMSTDALRAALDKQAKLIDTEFFDSQPHSSTMSAPKRVADILVAIVGLGITAVLLPFLAIAIYLDTPGPILVAQPRVGLRGKQFRLWRFRTTVPGAERQRLKLAYEQGGKLFNIKDEPGVTRVGHFLRRFYIDELPQFFNVLTGEMSVVGTRPPTLDEVKFYTRSDWQRLTVKPGMTGVWQINRWKYEMLFDSVLEMDFMYISRWKHRLDAEIFLNTLLHILLGPERTEKLKPVSRQSTVKLLNVAIDNLSVMELLRQFKTGILFTPNVDHLMKLQRDPEFYQVYAQADYRVCDSQILMYASRFLGHPLKEKISGSDFFPIFCEFHKDNEAITIFLLGGATGVPEKAKTRLNLKLGRDIIIGAHSPSFGFERNEQECLELIERVNQSKATVLAVGVGAPKQEKWICKYKHHFTHVKIFLAVGATIDFEAGVVQRAPQWMSTLGIEWLFRISRDPNRLWKRYLIEDLPFFWLLLKQRLGLYRPPAFALEERSMPERRVEG